MSVSAQITYSANPSRLQLYPRDADDSATVVLSGLVTTTQYSDIIFTYSKSGVLSDSTITKLTFNNSQAPFSKNYRIKTGKTLYNFRIYLRQGVSSLQVLRADSVVCGDVYIINGQSNATANATVSGTDAPYLWIRSFGNPTLTQSLAQSDTTWGIAQGNTGSTAYSIGVWGIRLAKMLCDSFNIPICIINGSRPGTSITEHQPSASNPQDLNTFYGRLYYRTIKAKVNLAAKAMFWWQGENDGAAIDAPLYTSRFASLRSAWAQHYPAVQKIFIVQTRMGCIDGAPEQRQVREAHRSFRYIYPEVRVMSTTNVNVFDGCHFNVAGYQIVAKNLYRQVSRDLFSASQPVTADPPDVVNAVFSNSNNTELTITFNQDVVWPALFNGNDLKDYFYLNAPVTVVSGSSSGNIVKLNLSGTSNAFKVSYLPNQYYNNTLVNYDGPWLTGMDNIGALSFYSFPVSSGLSISANNLSICASGNAVLTANKTGEIFQWYFNGGIINGANTNQYTTTVPGQYYMTMKDANNIVVTSNTLTVVQGSASTPPQITSNTGNFDFCQGGGIILSSNISANSYLWSTGHTTSSINVFAPGTYTVTIFDAVGCSATSTPVIVTPHNPNPPTILASTTIFCSGDSVRVIPSYGTVLQWSVNNSSDSAIYIKETSVITVNIQDAEGCVVTSLPLTLTKDVPPVPVITGLASICQGDSTVLTASGTGAFHWSTSESSKNITIYSAGTYSVSMIDSVGCNAASAPFNVIQNQLPTVSVSGNTHVCPGQTIQLTASGGSTYIWSTGATTAVISTIVTGDFTVTGRDANGCANVSPVFHTDISGPPVTILPATPYFMCSGKRATLTATAPTAIAYQWYKGNTVISGATTSTYSAGAAGTYKVKVTDATGCTAYSANLVITIATTPAASFTVTNQFDVCADSMVTLTANAGTMFTYQWQKAGINLPSGVLQELNTVNKGSYRVIVSSQYGCTKTSSALTVPIPSPTASVVAGGPKSFCNGDSVKLTANTGVNYNYQWQRNGTNIAGATAVSYTVKTGGTYRVRVYNQMSCSATSANVVVTVNNCSTRLTDDTNVEEVVMDDVNFKVYPNPFSDVVNIVPDIETDEIFFYQVLDMSGRLIHSGEVDAVNNSIPLDEVKSTGIYILSLEGVFGRRSYRLEKISSE
ncbi:MAG: sialate O-acetylesterase [Bacteroidota bacterium]